MTRNTCLSVQHSCNQRYNISCSQRYNILFLQNTRPQ
uniref:Uncharacterized protein n=1 Tax=Arundo donax TaxID=35708 RepID=A0A0A9AN29_ARUDO